MFATPKENYYNTVMKQIKAIEKHYEKVEKQRKAGIRQDALDAIRAYKEEIEQQRQNKEEKIIMQPTPDHLKDSSTEEYIPLELKI